MVAGGGNATDSSASCCTSVTVAESHQTIQLHMQMQVLPLVLHRCGMPCLELQHSPASPLNPYQCMHVDGRRLTCRVDGKLVIDVVVQTAQQSPACKLSGTSCWPHLQFISVSGVWHLLFGLLPLSPELANSSVFVHCCSSCSWTFPTCS